MENACSGTTVAGVFSFQDIVYSHPMLGSVVDRLPGTTGFAIVAKA